MALTTKHNASRRTLRDGEFLVDCAKARAALAASHDAQSEERAADVLGISRSVLRRILGRDDPCSWAIVTTPNAASFAEKCGIQLDAIQWSGNIPGEAMRQPNLVADYIQFWRDIYSLGLAPLVPLTIRSKDDAVDVNGILNFLQKSQTVQLCGPSGCGKSHLLTHLALMFSARGFVPVFARAAEFGGDIDALLDRAVSNVSSLSFEQFVRACTRAAKVPVIVLDAVNECQSSLRTPFFAALQKLRAQYDFPVMLSNQSELVLPPTLDGPIITVSPPDKAEKRALVEAHLGRAMPEEAGFSLDIISSAQDAMVWAEVFAHSDVATSRFALYEAYVRRRLGGDQHVAIAQRALALLAHEMRQTFVFSVPEATVRRAIDRVISTSDYADGVRLVIERSGLLPEEQGRVTFKHELLQDFFAAGQLLRVAADSKELSQALSKPLNAGLAEFAIGALASGIDIVTAFSELSSTALLSACLSGRCGPAARDYVEGECAAALDRLRDRYCAISFDLSQEHERELSIDDSRSAPFKSRDASYLAAAMMIFPDGRMVGVVLDTIRRIDEHIEAECSRLRVRYPDKKIGWRVRMFTSLYCAQPGPHEFRVALQTAQMSGLWRDPKDSYQRIAALLAGYASLTPGQLYFLIEGFHAATSLEVSPPAYLYDLAARAWSYRIYHLQLATTHMLTMHCNKLTDDDRRRFVTLVEGWLDNNNPVMNSCVIDVLKVLGALDDQFSPEDAALEFEEVLALPASQEAYERAFSIYCCMFDHPYDDAYGQAFYSLIPILGMADSLGFPNQLGSDSRWQTEGRLPWDKPLR